MSLPIQYDKMLERPQRCSRGRPQRTALGKDARARAKNLEVFDLKKAHFAVQKAYFAVQKGQLLRSA